MAFEIPTDQGFIALLQYLNRVTNDLFTPVFIAIIFTVAYLSTRNQNFKASATFSSTLCFLVSLLLHGAQAMSLIFVYIFGVVWGLSILMSIKLGD